MGPPTGVDMAVSSFFSSLGRCQFGNQWARSPATPTVNYSRMVNCCCCPCLAQIIGAAISYRGGGISRVNWRFTGTSFRVPELRSLNICFVVCSGRLGPEWATIMRRPATEGKDTSYGHRQWRADSKRRDDSPSLNQEVWSTATDAASLRVMSLSAPSDGPCKSSPPHRWTCIRTSGHPARSYSTARSS